MSINEKELKIITALNDFAIKNNGKDDLFISVKVGGSNNAVHFNVWHGKWHDTMSKSAFDKVIPIDNENLYIDLLALNDAVLGDDFLDGLLAGFDFKSALAGGMKMEDAISNLMGNPPAQSVVKAKRESNKQAAYQQHTNATMKALEVRAKREAAKNVAPTQAEMDEILRNAAYPANKLNRGD